MNLEQKNLKKILNILLFMVPTPLKELKYVLKVKPPVVSPNKIDIDGFGNREFNNTIIEKYAYPIEGMYEINRTVKLDELRQKYNFTAPQSFAYGEKYSDLLKYIDKVGITKLY